MNFRTSGPLYSGLSSALPREGSVGERMSKLGRWGGDWANATPTARPENATAAANPRLLKRLMIPAPCFDAR